VPHRLHGGVLHEGGGGDAAGQEEDVQAEAGLQDADGGGGGGGVETGVQREGDGQPEQALQDGRQEQHQWLPPND